MKTKTKTKKSRKLKNNVKFNKNNLNKNNLLVIGINLIALIIGSLILGILITFILVTLINAGYFLLIKKYRHSKKSHSKKEQNNKTTKKKKNKVVKILLTIILSIILLIVALVIIFICIIIKDAPTFDPENLYMKEPSIIYDNNGQVIRKIGAEKREIISYEQLSEVLVDAIIATEDSRFFQHNGVDLPRFIKASIGQVMGNDAGGASTITMQISKKNYTSPIAVGFDGIKRKFTDIYMSVFKLEKKYTKQEILEFYVNSNSMGAGTYGVEEACQTYFGKSAKDINLAEAALIAGLFQAPTKYNPLVNPEAAETRRKEVLRLMYRHGYITSEERAAAESLTIDKLLVKETSKEENKYQAFIDTVVEEVENDTGFNPYVTPMEIYTTMDRNRQEYVDDVMSGNNFEWENDKVNAGISVLNVKTGEIVAIGAGRNRVGERQYNTATMNKRQIGSTAKPLYDYGPAIEYNNWSPGTPIVDEDYQYSDGVDINNWDSGYKGLMTLRNALKESRNIPALKAFQQVDNANIKTFVTNLGLSPEIASNGRIHEAHAIGAYNGESPLSMSAAYAAFANGGYYITPHSYTKVVYRKSEESYEKKIDKVKAMSEETAYMITSALVTTSTYGLGNFSKINGYTYAAKTGTTNYDSKTKEAKGLPDSAIPDLWVVGFDADYSLAVWYGYNDNNDKSNYLRFGNNQNLRLFQTVGKGVFTGAIVEKPEGVEEVKIESQTYPIKLPSAYTPSDLIATELFKKGTAPTEVSDRFEQLANVTGLDGKINGDTITLTWKGINTPNAINPDKIRANATALYHNVNLGINTITNYNNSHIGTLIYEIYKKEANGSLTFLGSTADTNFTYKVSNVGKSKVTFVVKSSYSILKTNASSGTEMEFQFNEVESVITSQLKGNNPIEISLNSEYVDPGITILENSIPITSGGTIKTTAIGKNTNKTFNSNNLSDIAKTADIYTITYEITYKNHTNTLKRNVIVK